MKKQDGIALIATLLIMAAIMALGVGTLFLSTMNLKIAENSRTHAVARYNAEAGMEAAIVKLKKDYEAATPKQFPTSSAFTLPASPDASTVKYQSVSYTPYITAGTRTQARVVIVGTGPNDARYQTEALLGAADVSSFPRGLVSEGVVDVNGNHTLLNAQIHGNSGFDLNGNGEGYFNCPAAIVTGTTGCTNLSGKDVPISAAEGLDSYTCKAKADLCDGNGNGAKPKGDYLKGPVKIGAPPYLTLRNDKDDDKNNDNIRDTNEKPVIFGLKDSMTRTANVNSFSSLSGCTHRVTNASLATSYPAGSKVCIWPSSGTGGSNVSVPDNARYSNITVIVKGDVSINGNASFDNVNLLSMGTLNLGGNVVMKGTSRLLADTKVSVNGNIDYSGSATIASGGDMDLNGNIYSAPASEIGMALMSAGNFNVNGNLKSSKQDLINVAIWAGGTARVNGGVEIRGGISSVGDLTVNGASTIDGRGNFTNADLSNQEREVAALSRR